MKTYSKFFKTFFLALALFIIFGDSIAFAQATRPVVAPVVQPKQTEYELLEPIPQLEKSKGKTDATTFLIGLFKLAIGIAGVLAVIMIIYGGVIKMSSDAVAGQSKANEIISNAIWGLLFAISAWLILYTINPKLVEIKFAITPIVPSQGTIPGAPNLRPGVPSPTPGPGTAMTPEQIAESNATRKRLQDGGVLTNAGPCTQGQGYGCTNLNGLPEGAIQGLLSLKSDCKCSIVVSGGTEPGPHKTHGVGKAIVDLRNESDLRSWMTTKGFLPKNSSVALVKLSNGRQITFTFEKAGQGNSTADHWHLNF